MPHYGTGTQTLSRERVRSAAPGHAATGPPAWAAAARRSTGAEAGLDQVPTGRGIPRQHLPRHPPAGARTQHAGLVNLVASDPTRRRDSPIERGNGEHGDRHTLQDRSECGRVGRDVVAGRVTQQIDDNRGDTARRNQVETESRSRRRSVRCAARASELRSGCTSIRSTASPSATAARISGPSAYTGPPSSPDRVTVGSPRTDRPPIDSRAFLIGWPSCRSRIGADQSTTTPALDAISGSTAMPAWRTISAQEPSPPTDGQLAPPRASTTASAASDPSNPDQLTPVRISTPSSASRAVQARTRPVARIAAGNTRPDDPTNVGPKASAHARTASGGNARIAGSTRSRPSPYRLRKSSSGSAWVRLSPDRPASNKVRPNDRR